MSSCGNIYVYASNFERIFGIPNSISNIESDASISVYPNPTSGHCTISLNSDYAEILVTNILGQQILKTHVSEKNTSIQLAHKGVYILSVTTKRGTVTQKIICR